MALSGWSGGTALSAAPLPPIIQARLHQHASATGGRAPNAGICAGSGHCWVIDGRELLLWKQNEATRVRVLLLPPGPPHQRYFVSVLTQPASSATTVVACSESGLLSAFLDASHSAKEPLHQPVIQLSSSASQQQQHPPVVTSFSAAVPELASGAGGPMFVGVLGSRDGSLFFIQGSPQGIFTKQLSALPGHQEPRGVLGTLGSVLSWTYQEAFLPGARFIKRSSSGLPPVAVHVAMADTVNHLHVFVLTASTLECWLVTLGMRPSEQLLWSFQSVLAAQHEPSLPEPLLAPANIDLAVVGSQAYLLLADRGSYGGSASLFVQRLEVEADAHPVHTYCLPVHGLSMTPSQAQAGMQPGEGCCVHVSPLVEDVALIVMPGHKLYEWSGVHSAPGHPHFARLRGYHELHHQEQAPHPVTLLSDDPDTLATSAVRMGPHAHKPAHSSGRRASSDESDERRAHMRRASGGSNGAGLSAMEEDEAEELGLAGPLDDGSRIQQGAVWLVMNATYGLLQLGLVGEVDRSAMQAAPQAAGPLTAEQEAHVHQLLNSIINQAAAMQAQQQPLLGLAAGLRHRLEGLGALASSETMRVFANYSTGLVDMMPKQWALGGLPSMGAGSIAGGLMSQLLAEKELKHALLLHCLGDGGVLHSLPKEVLRVLLENAEKVSVASNVLALHMQVQAEQQEAGAAESFVPLVLQVIHAAGQLTAASSTTEPLPPTELFYARPSVSVPNLLRALGSAAAQITDQASSGQSRPGDEATSALVQHAHDLGSLLGPAVAAAHGQRDALQASQHVSSAHVCTQLGSPGWLADQSAREALNRLSLACQAVRGLLLGSPHIVPSSELHLGPHDLDSRVLSVVPPLVELALTTFGVVEVLLAGFAAVVAAMQQADAKAALLDEYRAVRGRCCNTLLADAVLEVQAREAASEADGLPASDCLMWQVEELAAAHHCFPQLFDASEALQMRDSTGGAATERFHQHMVSIGAEEGAAESETFARYCYQRLLHDHRPADLLLLPPVFYTDLRQFLEERPQHADLLWPLLLRIADWQGAAGAVSLDARAHLGILPQHKRLLCLSRLSSLAAGNAAEAQTKAAQLHLLSVQARLHDLLVSSLKLPPSQIPDLTQVLDVSQLMDAALTMDAAAPATAKGQAVVLGLEAYAVCPKEVQDANRSKFKLAWQHTTSATSWEDLSQQLSVAEQAEHWERMLEETPVYQGAMVCCGHGAFGFGPSIRDTAPVQEVEGWIARELTREGAGRDLALQAFGLAMAHYTAQQQEA